MPNKKFVTSSLGLLLLGIIIIAANLRAPLTSVGPLVGLIRGDVHISNTLVYSDNNGTFTYLCFIIASSTKTRT